MSDIHARRRKLFLDGLSPRAAAVISGAREARRINDTHHPFRQPSDLLYLTGFPEPEAMAVFTPGKEHKFTLFVRPRDKDKEIWTGRRVGVEGAKERYGADQAFPIAEAAQKLRDLLDGCDEVLVHIGDDAHTDKLVSRTIATLRRGERHGMRAPQRIVELHTVLHEQRLIKDEEALCCLRRAVEITAEAHKQAMCTARAGMNEHEIEALVDYTFRRHGGYPGYGTIVGGGRNATILHYVDASSRLEEGQLLLIDAGCEFQGFTADVTRTFPIRTAAGGPPAFSPAQRRIYDLVLRAQLCGIERCRAGETVESIHERCTQVLTEGMIELGLLSGDPAALIEKEEQKKYYLHRTSHWLGMDVHDVGQYFPGGSPRQLQPGMVLTIEPGLYIAEDAPCPEEYRGMGVRIEDDVLITDLALTGSHHEVLTRAIPKQPDELLALIAMS